MRQLRYGAFLLLVLVVAACSNIAAPQTFNEKLAVGYGMVTAVRTSTTTLLTAKKISVDDAQNVQAQADNARAGLDIARSSFAGNPASAEAKLSAVTMALQALSTYLATKGN